MIEQLGDVPRFASLKSQENSEENGPEETSIEVNVDERVLGLFWEQGQNFPNDLGHHAKKVKLSAETVSHFEDFMLIDLKAEIRKSNSTMIPTNVFDTKSVIVYGCITTDMSKVRDFSKSVGLLCLSRPSSTVLRSSSRMS